MKTWRKYKDSVLDVWTTFLAWFIVIGIVAAPFAVWLGFLYCVVVVIKYAWG